MTLQERYNLIFNKKRCIKVIITDSNTRVSIHIIKIDDNKMFDIKERTYVINYDAVFISDGIPTYFYYIDNPNSISKRELAKHHDPLDPSIASYKIAVSSTELNTAIKETISKKIIRYAEDGDKKIINTVLFMGGFTILAVLGGGYFLYTMLEKIWNFMMNNEGLLEAIKDALINGVGN